MTGNHPEPSPNPVRAIKIGFSSVACPNWDLATIVGAAKQYGYDGVELRGLRGELYLPFVPELAGQPEYVRRLFGDNGIELVCLASSATLASSKRRERSKAKSEILDYLELAGKLGCTSVRIMAGEGAAGEDRQKVLSRVTAELASLGPAVSRLNVRLLVENGGDFAGATDLWFMMDAVNHPLIRCCWNQCQGMTVSEGATNSLPRLGSKMGMVHVCDAEFDEEGVLQNYKLPGEGGMDIARQIEILKGMVYDGYVVFEWPRLWVDSLAAPEVALPAAADFLGKCVNAKQQVLSAYKGDKNAPKLTTRRQVSATNPVCHTETA